MNTMVLLRATTRKDLITAVRYSLDSFGTLIALYVIFLIVFHTASAVSDGAPGASHSLEAILVGYVVWFAALTSFGQLSDEVTTHAEQGTLEQLAMSPYGLTRILVTMGALGLGYNLVLSVVFLFLLMLTTGHWLDLNLPVVLPMLVLAMAGIQGVGLLLGGVALIFKKIGSLMTMVQFAFLGLIALDPDRFAWAKLLPLAQASDMIREVILDDRGQVLRSADMAWLVGTSIAYFVVGIVIFNQLKDVARRRGVLGQF